jgi:hypothetical protein
VIQNDLADSSCLRLRPTILDCFDSPVVRFAGSLVYTRESAVDELSVNVVPALNLLSFRENSIDGIGDSKCTIGLRGLWSEHKAVVPTGCSVLDAYLCKTLDSIFICRQMPADAWCGLPEAQLLNRVQ